VTLDGIEEALELRIHLAAVPTTVEQDGVAVPFTFDSQTLVVPVSRAAGSTTLTWQ
jgi:hypothetical protein